MASLIFKMVHVTRGKINNNE